MKRFLLSFWAVLSTLFLWAQDTTAVQLSVDQKRVNKDEVAITITAKTLKPGVALYALQKSPDDAVFSQVSFDSSLAGQLKGDLTEKGNIQSGLDSTLSLNVSYVTDSIQWIQTLNVAETDTLLVKGKATYMFKLGDEYPSVEKDFRLVVMPEAVKGENVTAAGKASGEENQSLLWIFVTAFAGGLLALLTPCVYSMIPVTVSFFTKRSKTKLEGRKNAVVYSLSIIFIFTFIGFLITLIWGPTALNDISTNWIFNLFIFLVFVVFGISFLGAFEITLPASWSNKADSRANASSFLGIFFMAMVLVVVSFSCTGPILGLLLPVIFKGGYAGPLIGFFGFSLALSIPFALFAFFPSWLNSLSKPGGWMNSIKVTLGFIELALALKFLSNADLAKNWRILDREIFIVLWIVIFLLLGLYLLGKLKFKHDDELPKNDFGIPYLSVTRLFFAIAAFSMVVYLTPGLWGAPLKGLGAFLPPMGTQDFNADDLPKGFDVSKLTAPASGRVTATPDNTLPHPVRFAEAMKKNEPDVVINNGMVTYFDYQEALEVARKLKKPLMLDFTGINCVNCRLMETQVWSDPEVMKLLKEDFVIASLFVDVHDETVMLPVAEQFYSEDLGKQVETLGDLNTHLQVSRFGSNSQPNYFFLDGKEERLLQDGYGYNPAKGVKEFKDWLLKAIETYKSR
ncbi:cytochrome c biogenesis protein CcdA [Niabella yanshanensis]|uniref:Cytochrome c biogenesis protein CcdA n=1 Tax=Niabella yanshanensis TaxID=577386 RepID=A0ABZ0WC20_9BACT|nr:thioredoxin family protein [Niabella yanshanensis]WQD39780.1 cytochrome c biogenesis protein CcdA [Niabella yanshanensis]